MKSTVNGPPRKPLATRTIPQSQVPRRNTAHPGAAQLKDSTTVKPTAKQPTGRSPQLGTTKSTQEEPRRGRDAGDTSAAKKVESRECSRDQKRRGSRSPRPDCRHHSGSRSMERRRDRSSSPGRTHDHSCSDRRRQSRSPCRVIATACLRSDDFCLFSMSCFLTGGLMTFFFFTLHNARMCQKPDTSCS